MCENIIASEKHILSATYPGPDYSTRRFVTSYMYMSYLGPSSWRHDASAPRRLVGGMARDVCRPHQEDRLAQGRTGIVRYALATTGGDEPPQRAAPRYLRGCSIPAENSVLCAVVLPAGQVGVIQAWRRDALSCDVRCAPPGAPTEALKSAADMPWSDSNAGATDHARLNTSRV
eukprot:SAG25_NODE_1558_length_2766_cov_4.634904_4_plen_174_part_00